MALHDDKESTSLLLDYADSAVREPGILQTSNSRRYSNLTFLSYLIFAFSVASFMVLYVAIDWRGTKRENVSIPPVLNQVLPIFTNQSSSNNYTNQIFNDSCTVPIFDLYDESEKLYFVPHDDAKNCDRNLKPLTELSNGSWRITNKKEGMTCKARCYELPVLTGPLKISDWFPPGPTQCEFLEAVCWENGREIYGYIHTQILPRPKPPKTKNIPDVFVILVDSMSSRMMKRSLAKTVEFMTQQFQAVDFPFYSQVASRSPGNARSLWFGKQVEAGTMQGGREIKVDWSEEEYCNHYMDDKPNMFKDFLEAGYTTNYIDDWYYQTLTTNPDCKGFQNYYTNHTFFPFVNIFENTNLNITKDHLRGRKSCREAYSAALEYFEQFAKVYSDRPKFVWYWSVHLAHNFLMGADRLDKPLLEFLQGNSEMFDNAFFVLMADHGFRMGTTQFYASEIGNLERHNPALMMSVPKKYRNNGILEVLTKNSKRLQTHYDLRATLLDIAKVCAYNCLTFKQLQFQYQPFSQFTNRTLLKMPGEKGHSLLREQPLTPRNCETLPIIQDYCICKSKSIDMKYDTKLSNRLATALITYVHDILEELNVTSQCHKYEFDKVTALTIISLNGAKVTYKIVVKTKQPAIFETLVTDNETGKLEFGAIERVDRYGTTTYCTKKTHYTPLCYCIE
ncbi:hypothetical protein CRE_14939 [Caenorhabditis remanei]|uniref:Uncharacterized protein n=1 Tax=Caenorhabditis remanei TaxID=31234 RepID=E3NBX8_CAERE|nr:hypothetical protein CRE_14939 [Caenorhabditis remanei]